MPILRALILLLATPSAFAGLKLPFWSKAQATCAAIMGSEGPIRLEEGSIGHVANPREVLPRGLRALLTSKPTKTSLKQFEMFLTHYQPWKTRGYSYVGHSDGVRLRIDALAKTINYTYRPRSGSLGLMIAARNIARVAMAAREAGADLRQFAAEFTDANLVHVVVPLDLKGMDFVIGLENRMGNAKAFEPIQLYKRERRYVELPPAPVVPKRWYQRVPLISKRDQPAAPLFRYDNLMIRRFDEGTVHSVSSWLRHQFREDWELNPVEGEMTIALPSPRGVGEVAANGRRVVDVALSFWREGRAVPKLRLRAAADNTVLVRLPYSEVGHAFLERLSQRSGDAEFEAPLVGRGLVTAADFAPVRQLIAGLEPVLPFVRGNVEHFVAPEPVVGPTPAELESARWARGGALPPAMLPKEKEATLRRAELYYSLYGPWTPVGDDWTASNFGVDVRLDPSNSRLVMDLGEASPQSLNRVRDLVVSLAKSKTRTGHKLDFGQLSLRTDRSVTPHLILEAKVNWLGTRVLMQLRDSHAAEALAEPTTFEQDLFDTWVERQGVRVTELFPLRTAAE